MSAPSELLVVPTERLKVLAATVKPKPTPTNGKHTDNGKRSSLTAKAPSGVGIHYPKEGISVFDDFDARADWFDDVLGSGWKKDGR